MRNVPMPDRPHETLRVAAAVVGAILSSFNSALNSTATLVSIDLVKNLNTQTSDRKHVLICRVTACVVMLLAMLWSTQGDRFKSVFEGVNAMIACLAPTLRGLRIRPVEALKEG